MGAIKRIILIVLDSAGIGAAPDAEKYGDSGSNTLGNIAAVLGGLRLPHLALLGLGNTASILGVPPVQRPTGNWGRLQPAAAGKDTTSGHWELTGVILKEPFPLFPKGFPPEIIRAVERAFGRKVLGNRAASGTKIIDDLGLKHMETGYPIVYTSADSVFQIAAHEEVIPVPELYDLCRKARKILQGKYGVGRVIARPFIGNKGSFRRTANRRDFSLAPPQDTVLDRLLATGREVIGIGKIEDIFAGRGLSEALHTTGNLDGMNKTLAVLARAGEGLVFVNLVDFDTLYGHRNDPAGYARGLAEFDQWLPKLYRIMESSDLLIITADHGCDPTTSSTDHSREYVPLLIWGKEIPSGINLGDRKTFADVAATIAALFNIQWSGAGDSFHRMLSGKD
jgi:phosphopentomutase